MPDFDIQLFARDVHGYLTDQCEARPYDERAKRLRAAAWSIVTNNSPLVFSWCSPGFLLIGDVDRPALLVDPGLAGLADAWEIFIAGPCVVSCMTASDLPGAPSGKALRNRLEHAAAWVERLAHCPALAKALRSPSIVVGRDGSIEYNPTHHRPLILHC